MPVKIRQKQTLKTEWVTYDYYVQEVNKNLYETLEIKDVYELYNSISGTELWQASIDKERALTALNDRPDIFRIEYSDKNTHGFTGILRPVKTPIAYAIMIIKPIINSCKSILKKDYIKLTIIGLLILIIWFFIYPLFKSYFGHS